MAQPSAYSQIRVPIQYILAHLCSTLGKHLQAEQNGYHADHKLQNEEHNQGDEDAINQILKTE